MTKKLLPVMLVASLTISSVGSAAMPMPVIVWLRSLTNGNKDWKKCHTVDLSANIDKLGVTPEAKAAVEGLKAEYRANPYFAFRGTTDDPKFRCTQIGAFALRLGPNYYLNYYVQDISYLRPPRDPARPLLAVNVVRVC